MMGIIQYVSDHQVVLASVAVAVIDCAMALMPSVKGNGILHQVYVWLVKEKGPQA